MNREHLLQRTQRTHAIVEGALLGDIAIVFLLMRVYLPLPVVRNLLKALASVPFVMLIQRRGLKIAILASLAAYVLLSALVGPFLGLAAIDAAVAGVLVGVGRRFGLKGPLNVLWTGPVYAVLDLIIPTIVTVLVFRYPLTKIVKAAHNLIGIVFQLLLFVLTKAHLSRASLHAVKAWQAPIADHWQLVWIVTMVLYGLLTMYLVVLVSEMVLKQIPEETLSQQGGAP